MLTEFNMRESAHINCSLIEFLQQFKDFFLDLLINTHLTLYVSL